MVHTTAASRDGELFHFGFGHNGVIRKKTVVKGKAAHAGAHPHMGINALNAANLMLLAVNSLRETFQEKTYARVHSIITKGGDAVNAVPEEVVIESYVRAADPVSHKKINDQVNRTFASCAAAFGANVEIQDMAGSEALREDLNLRQAAINFVDEYFGKDSYTVSNEWETSSTDMGDVSALFPAIHAYATGAVGTSHGKDYFITDPYTACVLSAKFQVGLLMNILADNGKIAKEIIKNYTPVFSSIDDYLKHKRSINMHKETVKYNDDGTITLDYKN